jgi:hypothetical protein
MSQIDVKLPFAMTGPKTTAGKGVFRMARSSPTSFGSSRNYGPPLVTSTT